MGKRIHNLSCGLNMQCWPLACERCLVCIMQKQQSKYPFIFNSLNPKPIYF
jgi:hypothetical protein